MKSEPTEKTKGKKMAVSETADRKNGRSPGAGHDEWWERLMMEPGSGESAGTDAEPVIPSGAVAEEVSGEAGRKDTPPEPEDPVRRRTSGRQRRASLEEYRETYLTVPKIRNRKTVFVSEDVRDELDAIVRRLGGRGMSVSGLLENLAREHLAAYREDIEQWRKSDSLLPGVEYTRCMHSPLCTASMWKMRGGFFCGGSKGMFPDSRKPLPPRARRLLGGQIRSRRSQILE